MTYEIGRRIASYTDEDTRFSMEVDRDDIVGILGGKEGDTIWDLADDIPYFLLEKIAEAQKRELIFGEHPCQESPQVRQYLAELEARKMPTDVGYELAHYLFSYSIRGIASRAFNFDRSKNPNLSVQEIMCYEPEIDVDFPIIDFRTLGCQKKAVLSCKVDYLRIGRHIAYIRRWYAQPAS